MPFTLYAREVGHKFPDFVKELVNILATDHIAVSKIISSSNQASMNVKYTLSMFGDVSGYLKLLIQGNDIEITYTSSVLDMLTLVVRDRDDHKLVEMYFRNSVSSSVKKAEERILNREVEMLESPPTFIDVNYECQCGYLFTYKIISVPPGGEIICPHCRKTYYRKR